MPDESISTNNQVGNGAITKYVTAMIGELLFGLPISRVQDVFMPDRLTRVPMASDDVAGVLNLSGQIVTAIDMPARLGLTKNNDGKPPMAVGVEMDGVSYSLLIDSTTQALI